jgi:SulP family sulfate permease
MRDTSTSRRPASCKGDLGSTFVAVIKRYAACVHGVGSHPLVAGLGERVYAQLDGTGAVDMIGREDIFRATPAVGESLSQAGTRVTSLP